LIKLFKRKDMIFINTALAAGAEAAAEATSSSEGVLASLGINGTLFIFQLINFAVVAIILWFLILKPLTKKMAERQKMIDQSIDNAKKIEANLIMSDKKYQERIDQAKVEANKVIDKTQAEASKLGEELKAKSKKEIEGLIDQAKKNIKVEREEMLGEVKKEAVNLVIEAIAKILPEKMDGTKDHKLIEETIKSLK